MKFKSFFLENKKLIFSVVFLKIFYFLSFFGIGVFTYFSIFNETISFKYTGPIVFLLFLAFFILIFLSKFETELRTKINNFKNQEII